MENIILILLASDIKTWIPLLIPLVTKHQCCIEESRFMQLGKQWGGMMRISGHWNAIVKMEDTLTNLKLKNDLYLEFKRSSITKLTGDYLPYLVQIVGFNQAVSISEITQFFMEQYIQIIDLQTDSFKSYYSDTKLLNILVRVHIPASVNIAELREHFMLLCEELNIDGLLEPEKSIK